MNNLDLSYQTVLVTGPNSMIGRAVCEKLRERKSIVCYLSREKADLMNFDDTLKYFSNQKPRYVIHLATHSGNIDFNTKYPADTFYRTTQMGLNVLWSAQLTKVEKVVSILSSCAIADLGQDVLKEDDLWRGLPNKSIECHGLAKRNLHAMSRQIHQQYGIKAICCVVNNSFGPYDSYDINKTKVVGGLIKRFMEAKKLQFKSVTCWGDGSPLREFIYCKDAAEGIVQCLERYDDVNSPINITSGIEISIKELAETIADIVQYKGQISWDASKPNGQMRKKLDDTKMKKYLDIKITPIKEALIETIEWYKNELTN